MAQANMPSMNSPVSPFTPQQSLGAIKTGYQNAMGNLNNAAQLSQNTTSGEVAQLGQTLGQQQNQIGANLTNRGLGNTTVSATAQQAPMQNYNIAMQQVANQGAQRQMGVQSQMAGLNQQGGQAQANLMNPYAQTGYAQQQQQYNNQNQQQQANQQAYQQSLANAFQSMNVNGEALPGFTAM